MRMAALMASPAAAEPAAVPTEIAEVSHAMTWVYRHSRVTAVDSFLTAGKLSELAGLVVTGRLPDDDVQRL